MASSIYGNIDAALQQIDKYMRNRASPMALESSSQVSATTPHRSLLDNVRKDLMHYDEEKHARIVYNIQQHLSNSSEDDPELNEVLERILEIVNHFQKKNEILVTPEKPIPVSRVVSEGEENLRAKSRRLFDLLNQM